MAFDLVAGRRVADVAGVQMAGEEHVGAALGEDLHGHVGPAHDFRVVALSGTSKG